MSEEWDPVELKESHPNKLLLNHINEVKEMLSNFLNFYSLPADVKEIAEYVAEYHDYGKLNKRWHVGNESNPDHSPLSVKYLLKHKKLFEKEKNITLVLWYLILKHHSSLTKEPLKDPELEPLRKEVENIVRNLDFTHKINLIDSFGLFKIADVCSAENKRIKLEKPVVNEVDVKKIIQRDIDTNRWLEQQKLAYLPDIALLRAYTGWGKTDTSLLFLKNKGVNKVFYLFPTITAINKFYMKLKSVFDDRVIKYFYFYDTEVKEDLDVLQNMFFVENFIEPYVITTIDQFLLSFLQLGKYYRKRVMFRNSGIVVDEVHLLNPLMLHLLTYFLKKFQEVYKFKVLLMSATLPNSMKTFLIQELSLPEGSFLDFSSGYKLKRRIQFEYVDKDIETSVNDILNNLEKGKKVLVVVNTVEKSISVAEKLREGVKNKDDVILLHARFMYKDRRCKEERIDERKTTPHILVATQVCEVSLDISYDFMFTELAPISSLIQRFGRVNRYGERVEETNVKIFRPHIEDERHYPYSKEELKIAEEIVKELNGENLKTEMDLLETLDRVQTYEDLQKELSNEMKKIDLEQFEKILQFFFSFDISEKELQKILEYRDSFTTLVIPSPECVEEEEIKKHITELLKEKFENKSFTERRQLFAKFKEISVPVPAWWLKDMEKENRAFPIIDLRDKIYDSFYGFREIKSEII